MKTVRYFHHNAFDWSDTEGVAEGCFAASARVRGFAALLNETGRYSKVIAVKGKKSLRYFRLHDVVRKPESGEIIAILYRSYQSNASWTSLAFRCEI